MATADPAPFPNLASFTPAPSPDATVVPIPQQYQAMFAQAAARYGIPLNILAVVAHAESGFNPTAVGDNGSSYGFFQIHLPAHPDVTAQQAQDPQFNINWGAQELAYAYKRYNGNTLATILFNNCPACADHYASTGQFGPTQALAQASQRYLGSVLAPVGGLTAVGTTGTDWMTSPQATTGSTSPPDGSPMANFLSGFQAAITNPSATGAATGTAAQPTGAAASEGMLSAIGQNAGTATPAPTPTSPDTSQPAPAPAQQPQQPAEGVAP